VGILLRVAASSRVKIMKARKILVLLFCLLVVLIAVSCAKPLEKSKLGRGGLPTEAVKETEAAPSADESKLPLYPGATRKATGSYVTSDSMETVVDYYAKLLNMEPEVKGERLQTRAFTTPEYQLMIVPIETSPPGTEIHFYLPVKKEPAAK
jgi:hypothetical protein